MKISSKIIKKRIPIKYTVLHEGFSEENLNNIIGKYVIYFEDSKFYPAILSKNKSYINLISRHLWFLSEKTCIQYLKENEYINK